MSPRPPSALEAVLALDVGTSSVRCLAYDTAGRAVPGAQATREQHPRLTRDGGAELDAETLLTAAVDVLAEAAAALAERGGRPLAVGVSTFWHGLLALDAAGDPLTPLYLWVDTRSGPAAGDLRRELDGREVHLRTGCVLHSSYWPAKLRWLLNQRPELRRDARFVSFGEFLEERLLGVRRCGRSMASGTGLLDTAAGDWDAPLLAHLGLDAERLNSLCDAREPAAGLREPYADRLPALANVPVFPAVGDGACSNVGAGATRPEEGALMIGTSAALRVLFAGSAPPPPEGLWRYRLDDRRELLGGALSNGGNLFAWLTRTLRLPPPEELEAALAAAEPDAHGLTVLPFLAGERNPDFPLDATGWFTGIRTATTAMDLLQAGMEAVAYRVAAIAERLHGAAPELRRFIATGGLLHSPAWMQLLADVLDTELVTTDVPEASSRGAALMALEALGRIPDALALPPDRGRSYRPDPARHVRYAQARARHERLYQRSGLRDVE